MAGERPLSIWTSLTPGEVVSIQGHESQDYVGVFESRTDDGLIIWIRDALNERKMLHFREIRSVRLDAGDRVGRRTRTENVEGNS
ncbi:UNVERIFIED_CONTAM: hypothetical protein ABIE34_001709 [Jeotgalibacillus campisalis]